MSRTTRIRPEAVLVALLGGSAVIHAVRPQVFEPLIPPALGNARRWVYLSGAAEVACVALLAHPASRRAGGWASAAVLIGVFPGNLYAVQVAGPGVKRALAVARLPLQVPMIRAAMRVARPDTVR